MELSIILLKQVMVMLLILVTGVVCHKKKMITKVGKQELSNVLLMIVNPIVIIMAYQVEFQQSLFRNLMISFGLSAVVYVLVIPLAKLFIRGQSTRTVVERFALIYPNCGFFGIPLISAVYGAEGVFYLSAHMAVFQIFSWTHGLLLMRGKSDEKIPLTNFLKSLISPAFIAPFIGLFLFLCRITFPEVLSTTFTYISGMNTPLAMLIAGLTLAESNLRQVFMQKRIYYIVFLKLLALPLAIMLVLMPFSGIDPMVATIAVLVTGCPTAVVGVLFAVRFERDAVYMSEVFASTTILCALTIPVIMYLCQLVFVG